MLEQQTFTVAGAFCAVLSCLFVLPVWFMHREQSGSRTWLLLACLMPLVLVMIVTSADEPTMLALITINLFTLSIPLIMVVAIHHSYDLQPNYRVLTLIFGCSASLYLYFLLIDNNRDIMILIINQEWAITLGYCIWQMVKRGKTRLFSERFILLILLMLCLQMSCRNIWVWFPAFAEQLPTWMFLLVTSGVFFIAPLGTLIGFSIICTERRQQQAEQDAAYHKSLLATLSHELRTPLNAIAGTAQLLKQRHTEPQLRADCDTIVTSAMNLANMASQMLNFSHLAFNELQADNKPTDLQHALTIFVRQFTPLCHKKKLSFDLDYSHQLQASYSIDWPKVQGVLINLVGNAIKFTEQGYIRLSVKPGDKKGQLCFMVEDSGVGIPAKDIANLLQPFRRGSNIKDQTEGSGLGLSITNKLLISLDSKLHIDSTLDQGSRFSFTLGANPCAPPQKTEDHETPILRGLNILLIEDNAINQKIMLAMLQQDKHQVTLAETGQAAIDASQTQRFDVILLDMRLPDMTGMDIYHRLIQQTDNPNRNTRFIAVTANLLETELNTYQQVGIKQLVSKPVSQQVLRENLFYSQQKLRSDRIQPHAVVNANDTLSTSPLFDPEPLSWISDNISCDEFDTYLQNVPALLGAQLEEINQALRNAKQVALKRSLHKLSGTASQLGLTRLAKLANTIENNPSSHEQTQDVSKLQQLCTDSVQALPAMKEPQ